MPRFQKVLTKVFEIREGEFPRTLLMFFYLFLTIASYITTSSARDSLFLKKLGTDQLPYVYMLIAIVVGLISPLYLRIASRETLNRLIRYTSLFSILNLLLFWEVLKYGGSWMFYVLYIWVSIFGAITTSQFWLLANHAFNPREAKRLFALIGAGGVLGGIFGGSFTNYGAKWFGTESLLLWCAGFVGISMLLAERVWKEVAALSVADLMPQRPSDLPTGSSDTRHLLKLIFDSRHLTMMTAILSMTVIIDSLTDYQLKYISNHAIGSKDQLTAFFGTLSVYRGVFSFFFQVFLTSRILKTLGVGASIVFLPTSLALGSLILAFRPVLWAVSLLKVSDGCFRFSIHRSGIELLYLPVPLKIKKQVKGFIDIFIDRFGLGVGGLLLWVFTSVLPLSIRQLSLLVWALAIAWITLSIIIKREYLNSFRLALEKKTIEPEHLQIRISDNATIEALTKVLESPDERQVLYAMRLLADANSATLLPHISPLLRHSSAKVRALTIEYLGNDQNQEMEDRIRDCLKDLDLQVRAEAIHYLCRGSNSISSTPIQNFLRHEDYSIVGAAIHCIVKYQMPSEGLIDQKFIVSALSQEGKHRESARVAAASALGIIASSSPLQRYLQVLLQDTSFEVVRSAIRSAGQISSPDALPVLIKKLAEPSVRCDVREALLKYGASIVPILSDRLNNSHESMAVRVNIPKVLSLIGKQEAVDALINNIHQSDQFLGYRIIKALSKMRVMHPTFSFKHPAIDDLILEELRNYYQFGLILGSLKPGDSANHAALQLLHKTLQERMDQKLEEVFRLLGLRYPPQDIYFAYNGIRSNKALLRASALEFLDNLLLPDLKRLLLPILEGTSLESFVGKGRQIGGPQPKPNGDYLEFLILGRDAWLKTIAIYVAGTLRLSHLAPLVRQAIDVPDKTISHTARWSWERLNDSAEARA